MSAKTPAPMATLYLRQEGIVYRFQVYERGAQLENETISLSSSVANTYDPTTGIWDNAALQRLIAANTPQHEIDIVDNVHEVDQRSTA